MEIVEVTASTTETLRSRRFNNLTGCILGFNLTSFTNEKGTAAIGTQIITLETIGSDTSDIPMSIMLIGRE